MSENSIKQVASKFNVPATTRGGSIPKVEANAAREFGREINQNSAMQVISQQSYQILQGKLKPNVSVQIAAETSKFVSKSLYYCDMKKYAEV